MRKFSKAELDLFENIGGDPVAFCRNVLKNPQDGTPFIPSYVQEQYLNSTAQNVWCCFHRRGGKCLEGGTLVVDPHSLKPTPISHLFDAKEALVFDFKKNDVVWGGAKWHKNPERKECLKFSLETGVDITLSTDHEVFTREEGWKKAQDLKPGNRILAPSFLPIEGDVSVSIEQIQDLVKDIEATKVLPDIVYRFNRPTLCNFFLVIWSIYGRIFKEQEYIRISTNSKDLGKELHHLLLRIGVSGRIDPLGNILITDEIDLTNFLNQIGLNVQVLDVRAPRRWETILEIKPYGYREVYDLEVYHHDHNFIANDIVVHNSYGLAAKAIFHAMTEPNQTILIFCPSETQRKVIFQNIDGFIRMSPIVAASKKNIGNSNANPVLRTFRNDSVIEGHILGVGDNTVARESRRGLSADYAFLDESQDFTEETWRVLLPIIKGNLYRECKQAYAFGTIVKPVGHYYDMIFKPEMKSSVDQILRIPITENPDYRDNPQLIDDMRKGIPENIWKTEYLLLPSSLETSVFQMQHIDQAFKQDYSYGFHNKKSGQYRIMGVDWDKVQAGTTILIGQYHPETKEVQMIWREEIEQGQFSLSSAVDRIFELYREFDVDAVAVDTGFGAMQIEQLILRSQDRMLDLHEKLITVTMQSKVETPDLQDPERIVKSYVKDFMVELIKRKFEDGLLKFPQTDAKARDQFYDYEIVRESETRRVYSKENEHIIDATGFIMYAIFQGFDNFLGASFSETSGVRMIDTTPTYQRQSEIRTDVWAEFDNREDTYTDSWFPREEF